MFSDLLDGGRNTMRVTVGTKYSWGKNISWEVADPKGDRPAAAFSLCESLSAYEIAADLRALAQEQSHGSARLISGRHTGQDQITLDVGRK